LFDLKILKDAETAAHWRKSRLQNGHKVGETESNVLLGYVHLIQMLKDTSKNPTTSKCPVSREERWRVLNKSLSHIVMPTIVWIHKNVTERCVLRSELF
jgi:hypothetical protein